MRVVRHDESSIVRLSWFERKEVDLMTFSESNLQENFYKKADRFSLCTNELLRNGVEVFMFVRVDSRRRRIKDSRDLGSDAFCLVKGELSQFSC